MLTQAPSWIIAVDGFATESPLIKAKMTETPRTESESDPESIDSSCLVASATGNVQAFSKIVERWQSRLINYFYRGIGNRADAEDLAQETFVHLYRAAPRYEARNNFNAFLFTVARRRMIDHQRQKIRKPLDFIDPTEWPLQQQTAPADPTREIELAFHRALHDLAPKQRQAILLRQQQNLNYEEIAEALDVSLSSVKTLIHRARIALRTALKEYHNEPLN